MKHSENMFAMAECPGAADREYLLNMAATMEVYELENAELEAMNKAAENLAAHYLRVIEDIEAEKQNLNNCLDECRAELAACRDGSTLLEVIAQKNALARDIEIQNSQINAVQAHAVERGRREMQKEYNCMRAERDAALGRENRLREIAERLEVLAVKWVDAGHHDWSEIKKLSKALEIK